QQSEFLNALPCVHLGRIDVALVIDRNVMQRSELPSLTTDATESPHDLLGAVVKDADFAIGAVGRIDELLLLVGRTYEFVDRARRPRVLLIEVLGHERSVLAEDVNAIVGAIADVDHAV